MQYRAKQGETLDYICWLYYGKTSDKIVEQVLEANRHLRDEGPLLSVGIKIELPEIVEEENKQKVKLWQ